jgi:UDP-glucose 4-epimerase
MDAERMQPLRGVTGETFGSIVDRAAIEAALAASGATAILSCAGYGAGKLGLMRSGEQDRDAAMAVNVTGHGHVLEAAAAHGLRRVVWTSSTVVFGPAGLYGPGRVDEDAARAPATVYGLTKLLAEEVSAFHARRTGLEVVGVRLPLVLGPGLWYEGAAAALAAFFAAAGRGGPARLAFHDAPVDLAHVSDVADALVACLAHTGPTAQLYNLEGFTARASELAEDVRSLVPRAEIAFEDTGAPPLLFPLVSGARFRREVGFVPRHDRLAFVRAMLSEPAP